MKKGSKIYSILLHKCPRCHEGNLFAQKSEAHYNLFGFTPNFCPVCGQSYILEPGFYYGSMYISYAMSVFIGLPQFILYYAVFDLSFWIALAVVFAVQLLLTPFLYKTSRSLWINTFVNYDEKYTSLK